MRIRDIMTTDIITITSNTTIAKADDIMEKHKVSRLPVVDDGKLVGIVSKNRIMKTSAPENVPIAFWKLPHFVYGREVKEIMIKDVVTVTPDMTVEGAAFIAQSKGVGATPVVEGDKLVGIVSSNDYHYKILNPLLGVKQKGQRVVIKDPAGAKGLEGVCECLSKHKVDIRAVSYINLADRNVESDLLINLDTTEIDQITAELRELGYNVELR